MKEKRLDLELLRILAIFGVVFNHTQEWGFELYTDPAVSGVNLWACFLLRGLCKAAVPLFLLVSGGLLLWKEEPLSRVLRRRFGRVAAALAVFSVLTYCLRAHWDFYEYPGVYDFLRRFWKEGVSQPYWYLYMYLGLMLILPILRKLIGVLTERDYRYLLILHLILYPVLGTVGAVMGWRGFNPDLRLYLAEPWLFYFLMGHYLLRAAPWEKVTRRQRMCIYGLGAAGLAGFVLLGLWWYHWWQTLNFDYIETLIFLPTLAIYVAARQLFQGRTVPLWLRRTLETLGSCVFGTYLLESVLRHALQGVYLRLQPVIHTLPACLCWVCAVVAAGMAVTWVLRQVPGLKKLL